MQIFVKTLTGKTITLDVEPSEFTRGIREWTDDHGGRTFDAKLVDVSSRTVRSGPASAVGGWLVAPPVGAWIERTVSVDSQATAPGPRSAENRSVTEPAVVGHQDSGIGKALPPKKTNCPDSSPAPSV